MTQRTWHALEPEDVLREMGTDVAEGLTDREAAGRLDEYGPNQLRDGKRVSPLRLLVGQLTDFMVLVLVAAAGISFILGETGDAVTIMAIVLMNAVLGFVQEYRAEKSLAVLKRLTAPTARVVRGGTEKLVPAAELIPGDILLLEAGDRVSADARIIWAKSLEAEEAALTGESLPVRKDPLPVPPDCALGERSSMVFMGTGITRGHARAVVVGTGMMTEMGTIARLIEKAGDDMTPLQRRLDSLGRLLVLGCLLVVAAVVGVGILRGEPPLRMFMAGVSLAVAAIPEGLPAIVTIGLALGVQRMIKVNAIVRRLPAVETLGCTTVICSDKTGTLTKNEMTVRKVYAAGRFHEVTGSGYSPKGEILAFEAAGECLGEVARVSVLCNNARLERRKGAWGVTGDPTEGALLAFGAKAGLYREELERSFPRVDEVPFESERKRMTVVSRSGPGRFLVLTKGAPDVVIDLCRFYHDGRRIVPLTPLARRRILAANEQMAGEALRVLAAAGKDTEAVPESPEEAEKDLVFYGLVGMIDPPRPEARRAVATCKSAGIRTVMITGDHALTALAVAAELGIASPGDRIVTGRELDVMSDDELRGAIEDIRVFARVSPKDKLRIVKVLKSRGHVVAMTGDGVNDAPALKEADIGVAMGRTGTEVTREAASMVLTDDNFATIVAAVREGRAIYDNIRKFIRYLLSCNVGEVLVMFLSSLAGLSLPLVPIQILWVNLVTDGLPAMALGVEPPEPDVMLMAPRGGREGVFSRGLGSRILFRGILISLATLAVFTWGLAHTGDLQEARTMAFATLVMSQLFHVFDCRSERRSLWEIPPGANPLLLLAVASSITLLLAVIYVPAIAPYFDTHVLSLADWTMILAAAACGQILQGIQKILVSRA